MNRLVVFVVSSIIFSAISACDLMKDVTYVVTPNPLELKGDNLEFSVDVTIPEKGISKKFVLN